jgi:hypothetical protein
MRRRLIGSTVALLATAFGPPRVARAGACTEGDDRYYVEVIEDLARGKAKRDGDDPFYCLDLHLGQTNRWAGPRAARRIAALRASPLNPRLKKACARLIRGKHYWRAKSCVSLLAARGVRAIDDTEIFTLQRRFFPHGGLDPTHLAALGDPRAVKQLAARFDAERICYELPGDKGQRTKHCQDFSQRHKNRWQRKAQREARIAVLNALWHLAARSSRPFLRKVIAETDDKVLKQRATKVLARVEAQSGRSSAGPSK